jgi:hypothetical protein
MRYVALVVAVCFALVACDSGQGPRSPFPKPTPVVPPAPEPATLTVTGITPSSGSSVAPARVTIRGTGFLASATVTLGAAAATDVVVLDSTTIAAVTRPHDPGLVDVVVTNYAGASARLAAGFTFVVDQPYTIASSTSTVVAGGRLSVSWTAPRDGPADWIGFFLTTDSNYEYESRWWEYTGGARSGTIELIAPTPGRYEFRYLVDDGYVDVARSAPVTVTPP